MSVLLCVNTIKTGVQADHYMDSHLANHQQCVMSWHLYGQPLGQSSAVSCAEICMDSQLANHQQCVMCWPLYGESVGQSSAVCHVLTKVWTVSWPIISSAWVEIVLTLTTLCSWISWLTLHPDTTRNMHNYPTVWHLTWCFSLLKIMQTCPLVNCYACHLIATSFSTFILFCL